MIAAGLSPDAATFAATGAAAKLFGADKQIGSLAPGMIGNVLVTDGDLWAAKTKVRYLFVDGIKTDAGETTKPGAPVAPDTAEMSDAEYAEQQYAAALKSLPPRDTRAGDWVLENLARPSEAVPSCRANPGTSPRGSGKAGGQPGQRKKHRRYQKGRRWLSLRLRRLATAWFPHSRPRLPHRLCFAARRFGRWRKMVFYPTPMCK